MHIILGSQSPRRKEIFSLFTLPFEQIPSTFDEDQIPYTNNSPRDHVSTLSRKKGEELLQRHPSSVILTADTIVYQEERIFGKPKTRQEAIDILSTLQGRWHSVFTALTLHKGKDIFEKQEETRVLFNPLTPREIEAYLDRIHWADKAGSYAIQGSGGLIVKKIDGCYYNVMGLPINSLRAIFTHIGIDLWERIQKNEQ